MTWTLVRFLHLLAAITWVGAQLTLFAVLPILRRRLDADEVREIARAVGVRLAVLGAVALPTLLVTGIALDAHEVPESRDNLVAAKQLIWVAIVALMALHGVSAVRRRRMATSVLMLVLSLAAVFIGARLTEA